MSSLKTFVQALLLGGLTAADGSEKLSISHASNSVSITWVSAPNIHYRIVRSSVLTSPPWPVLTNILGNGETSSITVPMARNAEFFAYSTHTNPLSGMSFRVDSRSSAQKQYVEWLTNRHEDALLMKKIADEPTAQWLTGRETNTTETVDRMVSEACTNNKVALFVLYYIPFRDCGSFSSGGASNAVQYTNWVESVYRGIKGREAVFIVEPDALPGLDCLSVSNQNVRYELLRTAVLILRQEPRSIVYVDAGHSHWKSAATMVARLEQAGVTNAHGFSLNVSNFNEDSETIAYGEAISDRLKGMHFVVDTSRNGNGAAPQYEWCNPPNRALGRRPTTASGHPLVDAFLWIKYPGQSDGTCNGGPSAGTWWPEYALELSENASY
jgi:endoglucanase